MTFLSDTVLLSGAVAGCSSKSSSPSSSSSSSASSSKQATSTSAAASAEPSDYSTLLIEATDIVVPNDTFSAMPATPNPGGQPGVSGSFTNTAGSRVVGDTIMILPDASAASTALDGALSALENNVTIYHTIDGRRTEKKRARIPVTTNQWHTLRVEFQANHFVVRLNGKEALTWDDDTFKDAGKVGVWTKADSVTLFDDFSYGAK